MEGMSIAVVSWCFSVQPSLHHPICCSLLFCEQRVVDLRNIVPARLWNMDETGRDGRTYRMRVIVPRGKKGGAACLAMEGHRDHYTLICTICADGSHAPVVWLIAGAEGSQPTLQTRARLLEGSTPGAVVYATGMQTRPVLARVFLRSADCIHVSLLPCLATGWITIKVFGRYVKWLYDKWNPKPTAERPYMLLVDSHASRNCPTILQWLHDHHVILYVFIPNSTSVAQPLDATPFSILKVLCVLLSFLFCGGFSVSFLHDGSERWAQM